MRSRCCCSLSNVSSVTVLFTLVCGSLKFRIRYSNTLLNVGAGKMVDVTPGPRWDYLESTRDLSWTGKQLETTVTDDVSRDMDAMAPLSCIAARCKGRK